MAMNEEKLIGLVQSYKELYDVSDNNYHNNVRKENIWEEIAGEMKKTVAECKKRWTTLRDSYRKALKAGETRSGDSGKKRKLWRYQHQMEFLRAFIQNRQQHSNIEGSEDDSDAADEDNFDDTQDPASVESAENVLSPDSPLSTISSNSKLVRKQKATSDKPKPIRAAEVLQQYLEQKKPAETTHNKEDHSTKFFQSMEETVHTLAPHLQIEVKKQLFNVVHEAELQNLAYEKQTNYQNFHMPQPPHSSHSASSLPYHDNPILTPMVPSLQHTAWTPVHSQQSTSSPNPGLFKLYHQQPLPSTTQETLSKH